MSDPEAPGSYLQGPGLFRMSPRLKLVLADWKTWAGVAGVLVTLAAAFTEGLDQLAKLLRVEALPEPVRWVAVGVLALIALSSLISAWSRKSILLRPERFILSPDDPKHLVGREVEIQDLARECARHPLIFLQGDSGAGKSALVQAGLVPYCKEHENGLAPVGRLLPVFIDTSPLAWEGGLGTEIARALKGLSEVDYAALGASPPGDQSIWHWLKNLPEDGQRQLLLILDQIDDYAVAHRERFMIGRVVLSSEELEAANTDWAQLAQNLRAGKLQVLLVSRSDTSFVGAFRFVRERTFPLARIDRGLIRPILDQLTADDGRGEVVQYPEFGWSQLKKRLLRDVAREGNVVLPVQLAIAVQSFRRFTYLTSREYSRRGGLVGLERLNVERHLRDAAKVSGISEDSLFRGLLLLVSPDGQKTVPASRQAFSDALGADSTGALGCSIEHLERNRILRRQSGTKQAQEHLLLYHDYLAGGVREIQRFKNRPVEVLREHHEALLVASGPRARWRALLSICQSCRAYWERMRGRLSFGPYRRLILSSTLRFVPLGLIFSGLWLGGQWLHNNSEERRAERVLAGLSTSAGISPAEARELTALASLGDQARLHAFYVALNEPAVAPKLQSKAELLIQSILGLDSDGALSRELVEALRPSLSGEGDPVTAEIVGRTASLLHLEESTYRDLATLLVNHIGTSRGRFFTTNVGKTLEHLEGNLSKQEIRGVCEVLRSGFKQGGWSPLGLGKVLAALRGKLGDHAPQTLKEVIIKRMSTERDPEVLAFLARNLVYLEVRLTDQQLEQVVEITASALAQERTSIRLQEWEEALVLLGREMSDQQAAPLVDVLVKKAVAGRDHMTSTAYVSALGKLGKRLSVQQSQLIIESLEASLSTESHPYFVVGLSRALLDSLPTLDDSTLHELATLAGQRFVSETQLRTLHPLAETLEFLEPFLTDSQKRLIAAALLERLESVEGPDLAVVVEALSHLKEELRSEQVQQIITTMARQLKKEEGGFWVGLLGKTLARLRKDLPSGYARMGATEVLEHLKKETSARILTSLAETWSRLEPIAYRDVSRSKRLQVYVDLLNHPLVVGESRQALLEGVEQIVGESFDGDHWSFVDWATESEEGKKLNLDLNGRPWRPGKLQPPI